MKKLFTSTMVAATLAISANASAGDMFIDVGTNDYDTNRSIAGAFDMNTVTGVFSELSFSQLWATSIYDLNVDGTLAGTVTDTNIPADLAAAGIPGTYPALDGVGTVGLVAPLCTAQCDIDALSPIAPPNNGTDSEGFGQSCFIDVQYSLQASIASGAPVYSGGYIEFFFNDVFFPANNRSVFKAEVTGSSITIGNLDIFFEVVEAEAGFLFAGDAGSFTDISENIGTADAATFSLNTNVNPPIPTADMLAVVDGKAIRQASLNGGLTPQVAEPSTIAFLGLGILGLGFAARSRKFK